MTSGTIRFGVVGIHGYSRAHIGSIQGVARSGGPARLSAAVGFARELDEPYAAGLEAAGVKLVPDLDALLGLNGEIDIVTLPVGIALHVPMATKALQAGFPVYLEKPVTGTIQDFDRLAEIARAARGPLFIGFQDIFQPSLRELKRRILGGDLGKLRRVVLMAAWPRDMQYYGRNGWAGQLVNKGVIVLDSPLNNACAHYLNIALFLAGAQADEAARPLRVEAELYRANPIESADTMAVRVKTGESVDVVFAVSHACETHRGPIFRLEFDGGATVTMDRTAGVSDPWRLRWPGGREEAIAINWVDSLGQTARILLGERDLPACTLAMSRAHTLVVNGCHLATPIVTIAESRRASKTRLENGALLNYVPGMNAALDESFEKGCLLSETGLAPWAARGGCADVSALRRFALP